jgi:phosphoribosylformylglycinamidine synthase
MRWGIITFPGSNDDDDAAYAVRHAFGDDVVRLWHKDRDLQGADCVLLPGGFSYGDYLRCGAMARFSPLMESVVGFARGGGFVLGICNGFQVLCEAGLLPGALIRNEHLRFVCAQVRVRVEETDSPFTSRCTRGEILEIPIKHGDGCYVADEDTFASLERNRQILFRYVDASGRASPAANPNGSMSNVAGVTNEQRNVFGLMPHPEHAMEKLLGSEDGVKLFESVRSAHKGGAAKITAVAPGP